MSDDDDLLRIEEVGYKKPSSQDLSDVSEDIRAWLGRQNVKMTADIEFNLTAELHQAGAALPWLIRAYADSTRIARSKPIENAKKEKDTKDRFTILMFILLCCIGVASFAPILKGFIVAGPIAAICLWFLVKQVRGL